MARNATPCDVLACEINCLLGGLFHFTILTIVNFQYLNFHVRVAVFIESEFTGYANEVLQGCHSVFEFSAVRRAARFLQRVFHDVNAVIRLSCELVGIFTVFSLVSGFEITNLLVPGVNTDKKLVSQLCEWLASNGFANCPLHFSRCFPMFMMEDHGPTPLEDMYAARDIALKAGIKYVHLGNV